MWIVQKIKRESLVIQLPDSSLTELNNYNFYSMKEGFFMFGKKKKVKHAERHVDYKVSSENLAMPELHIGEDKGEEQPEKKDDGFITYENVAIPEVHIKKRKEAGQYIRGKNIAELIDFRAWKTFSVL